MLLECPGDFQKWEGHWVAGAAVLGKHLWLAKQKRRRKEVRGRATESAEDDGVTQLGRGGGRNKSRTFDCQRNWKRRGRGRERKCCQLSRTTTVQSRLTGFQITRTDRTEGMSVRTGVHIYGGRWRGGSGSLWRWLWKRQWWSRPHGDQWKSSVRDQIEWE